VQAAKTDPGSSAQPGSGAEGILVDSSVEQQAAAAYQQARASYAKGDREAALLYMKKSYELSKRAELLFNLARLEQELKACEESLADYRRYLELVPRGRYREEATRARDLLEQECPPPAPVLASTAPAPVNPEPATNESPPEQSDAVAEPPPYWNPSRIIGWSTIAGGTLAGAGAAYFQLQARQAKKDFQQSVDAANAGGPPADTSLQDRQHRYNHTAIALGATAGIMVAGGALLLLLDPGGGAQRSSSAGVYALPGLVGASYAQRF
jgi:tetratricopeptide (TPR) repeat protein